MTRLRACFVVLALAAAAMLAAAPGGATPAAVCRLQVAPYGEGAGDQFGINVAGEDDLNGDGYDDYAVSGFLNDAAGPDAGRVYVYFGAPHADALPDLVMTGEAAGDNLGLPDDEFDYDDFVKREFGEKKPMPHGIAWYWWLVAVGLLLALVLPFILRR